MLKLAIVGCGAVAEQGHLPALLHSRIFDVVAMVDRDEGRAKLLAERVHGCAVYADYSDAIPHVDAAIVALPHSLHAPASLAFLHAGKHVLVEKPMGLDAAECREMVDIAERTGACLAVGHMRRYFPALEFAKHALAGGLIGTIRHFDFRDGYTYCWPVASDFFFRRESAGGGVLFDTGAHTLDTMLWFFGDVARFSYRDDSHGGVEADALIEIELASGATGVVELSRTRILRNSAIIEGDGGSLEVFFHVPRIVVRKNGRDAATIDLSHPAAEGGVSGLVRMLSDQLADWHAAIVERRQPSIPGEAGLRVVELMEQMYRQRQPLVFPWESHSSGVAA